MAALSHAGREASKARSELSRGARARRAAIVAAGVAAAVAVAAFGGRPGQKPLEGTEQFAVRPELARKALSERARWRAQPSPEQARVYADALFAAGMEELALEEISDHKLLAHSPVEAAALRAEALLRLGRYREAIEAVAQFPPSIARSYAASIRARANYALDGMRDGKDADIRLALSGGAGIASSAWLLRARMALDENDTQGADAALRRAQEAGAPPREILLMRAEASLRAATPGGEAGAKGGGKTGARLDSQPGNTRLASIQLARSGDYAKAAAAFPPSSAQMTFDPHDRLLAALYRLEAGDHDVAAGLIGAYLDAAPENWVALDLAHAVSLARGDRMAAAAYAERLFRRRPALAAIRMMRMSVDDDQALAALQRAAGSAPGAAIGARTRLIGPIAPGRGALADVSPAEEALLAAAQLDDRAPDRQKSRAAEAAQAAGSAVGDLIAARLLASAGEPERAMTLTLRARLRAPRFLAAAEHQAVLLAAAGDAAGAMSTMREFISFAPDMPLARISAARIAIASGDAAAAEDLLADAPAALVFRESRLAEIVLARALRRGEAPFREAVAKARQAATPEFVAAALLAIGRHEDAAALARGALSKNPLSETAPALYLDAMTRAGAHAQAVALLEALVQRHPEARAAAALLEAESSAGSGGSAG